MPAVAPHAPASTPAASGPAVPGVRAVPAPRVVDAEVTTRQRILRLVVESGPVSVHDLARDLDLTAAGVRRHVVALEEGGQIVEHHVGGGPVRRGRPARRFVATERGQASLSSAYSDLASTALRFLGELAGVEAVEAFAARRAAELTDRHARALVGLDTAQRVEALAEGLARDGYAASVRPVPGGRAVQLCQGHCPVQDVAAQFPQLCEAETRAFSELLGVHVQRLSTLASGGHVCTTHVPLTTVSPPTGTTTTTRRTTTTTDTAPPASEGPPRGTVEGTR